MRIAVAQTKPVKGDIQKNILQHKKLLDIAISNQAELVIFPELSITGYEPELAHELAGNANDPRLNDFQKISDTDKITIGVGLPTKKENGIEITSVIFHPHHPRSTYSKKYLHEDELPFFIGGSKSPTLIDEKENIALAICYELSVPQHAEDAYQSGAKIYIASAVKSRSAMERSLATLSQIANKYSMLVLFSNCVGESGGYDCGGNSSIFDRSGKLIGQLDDIQEGILMIDTETQVIISNQLKN